LEALTGHVNILK